MGAVVLLFCMLAAGCRNSQPESAAARRWWGHVEYLASDELAGRRVGTDGHRKAEEYVAGQFEKLGLEPAGTEGYLQPVEFERRRLIEGESSLEVVRDGEAVAARLGGDAILLPAGDSGRAVEAEMVFAGYGLTIGEYGHDDFANIEAAGKVIVFLQGAPPGVPPLVAAHYSSVEERVRNLERLDAAGFLVILNPRLEEVPWERMSANRGWLTERLDLADPELSNGRAVRLAAYVNAEFAPVLLGDSGASFDEILRRDREKRPLPVFGVTGKIRAKATYEEGRVVSNNVAALLPGSNDRLKGEYVVLSAHLDHLGVGNPVDGDAIYNGAVDNASGVAAMLEVARELRDGGEPPRRSILFLACTAEESGLLGSKYFANRPTVEIDDIVANINVDTFLPFLPFRSVLGYGMEESTLGEHFEAVAGEFGVEVQEDPEPERNIFIRSDHYSFVKEGVPALFPVVGFDLRNSLTVIRWFRSRYHAPSDDLSQPMEFETAVRFNQLVSAVIRRVANVEQRPEWRGESFFGRFARERSPPSDF